MHPLALHQLTLAAHRATAYAWQYNHAAFHVKAYKVNQEAASGYPLGVTQRRGHEYNMEKHLDRLSEPDKAKHGIVNIETQTTK